jgi:hypothetical protein
MELLLNLAWLLLGLPAYWLWRGRKHARTGPFSALQFLLTLGCMLVILFPVISATDDLCAMRAEIEESPTGKHSMRQASQERTSASTWHSSPALLALNNLFCPGEDRYLAPAASHHFIQSPNADLLPARAPPFRISPDPLNSSS